MLRFEESWIRPAGESPTWVSIRAPVAGPGNLGDVAKAGGRPCNVGLRRFLRADHGLDRNRALSTDPQELHTDGAWGRKFAVLKSVYRHAHQN